MRLFLGLPLDDEDLAARVVEYARAVAFGTAARIQLRDSLHLTVSLPEDLDEAGAASLVQATRELLQDPRICRGPRLELRTFGLFRTAWYLRVNDLDGYFARGVRLLAMSLGPALTFPEPSAAQLHLTIARPNVPGGKPLPVGLVPPAGAWRPKHLVLYESHAEGAAPGAYRVVERFPLSLA